MPVAVAQEAVGRRLDRICEIAGLGPEDLDTSEGVCRGRAVKFETRVDRLLELVSVTSSFIDAYRYDAVMGMLAVRFRDQTRSVYCYLGVPEEVYAGFVRARSKGEYFSLNIRGKYSFKRVEVARRVG